MNLLIISHTPHYRSGTELVGWGPTVREIDQLAGLFGQVRHLAVLYNDTAPLSSLPYTKKNISFVSVRPAGGDSFFAKLDVLSAYFEYWKVIRREINALGEEDVIHVRCPANLSLLAVFYLMFTRHVFRRWIKYAGNWAAEDHEPFTYALQRWLLKRNFARALVTVNGRWRGQEKHIFSFYNPSFSADDIQVEQKSSQEKKLFPPYKLLFVGNVNEAKGAGRTVHAALKLILSDMNVELDVVGDGGLCDDLEAQVGRAGKQDRIRFHRWLPHKAVLPYYAHAHFIVLPSRTEGWPKVLSEGMAYGAVPLAGAVSSIPQILQECKTGMSLDPLDEAAFAEAVRTYIDDPARWSEESNSAMQVAMNFTYEAYLQHLQSVFEHMWKSNP